MRLALAPIEACVREFPALGPSSVDVDADVLEPALARRLKLESAVAAPDEALASERIGDSHAYLAGEMIVARPRVGEHARFTRFVELVERGAGRDRDERLDSCRDLAVRETIVAVPALALRFEQTALDETREVRAHGRRSDMGAACEVGRRQSDPARERAEHGRSGLVAD